ncbi:HAD-like domain-containing protein [Tricharina praecox]|uniref:HAD-like domain-containing protein n=1 Tax=Tricharina praecox TaxID=43433 RepID=UPI00221F2DA0|nr:HAD-like domain-containing protein [Tricharina praecox]KAI5857752.1 HAD-like domain-containing protein [Tricharina praecox]
MIPYIRHLILDFDETLTLVDTISLLSSAAYRLRPTTVPALPPWSYFAESWLDDYNRHVQSYPHLRRTLDDEYQFLASLAPVERASIRRIEKAGVFTGLRINDLAHAAEETVTVRPGLWQACRPVLDAGGRVSVLSVNWSKEWIRSAERVKFELEVEVVSNSLCEDGTTTTGEITREPALGEDHGIWTAQNKTVMMKRLVEGGGSEGLVVYVGDSSTDLMCLLQADVGVVIGDKLDAVCERFGIELVDGLTDVRCAKDGQQRLYKVRDLQILGRWIREE